jgi:hypothetical protein
LVSVGMAADQGRLVPLGHGIHGLGVAEGAQGLLHVGKHFGAAWIGSRVAKLLGVKLGIEHFGLESHAVVVLRVAMAAAWVGQAPIERFSGPAVQAHPVVPAQSVAARISDPGVRQALLQTAQTARPGSLISLTTGRLIAAGGQHMIAGGNGHLIAAGGLN